MDEYMTVELTLDNDEVVECAILTLFEAGGGENRVGRTGRCR